MGFGPRVFLLLWGVARAKCRLFCAGVGDVSSLGACWRAMYRLFGLILGAASEKDQKKSKNALEFRILFFLGEFWANFGHGNPESPKKVQNSHRGVEEKDNVPAQENRGNSLYIDICQNVTYDTKNKI